MNKQQASYGSWKSPITAELIAGASIKLEQMQVNAENIYWIENRPSELGRCVIVQKSKDGTIKDLLPPSYSARSSVHEYGGGAYAINDDIIYFVNYSDQKIYSIKQGTSPQAITKQDNVRYADGIIDKLRNKMFWVKENHQSKTITNSLVSICLNTGEETIIAHGNDFYCSPSISHNSKHLSWISWNHPNMPWDNTSLWVGELNERGEVSSPIKISDDNESVLQPQWSPDGSLYFVSDRSNWWNIYQWKTGQIKAITQLEAEFGRPHWVFGMSSYAIVSSTQIVASYTKNGIWKLAEIDTLSGTITTIETELSDISYLRCTSENAAFIGGSPTHPPAVMTLNLSNKSTEVVKFSSNVSIDSNYISKPESISFSNSSGQQSYGFYYKPCNPEFTGTPGEKPPLVVKCHGGPTSATTNTLNLPIQFWTSRGFAVVDVNYSGSTGFGREYRQRLYGQWGVVDVDDCASLAVYLSQKGEVDTNRMAISGGSAGGYTVLCALTFKNIFRAGASYYGVSNLEALAQDTHKFESQYEQQLVGPYPERKDLYFEHSPINFSNQLSCPVIFLQGSDDTVVPPSQSEIMVEALRKKGIPVAYLLFAGEGHGFRKAETVKKALEAELYFYSRVFNFNAYDTIEPIKIINEKALCEIQTW